ncbi:sensor histidine kinase [Brevibacterium album]|uniref:sensor histidine kinase n=1 Tax=Brevibacterium album TaxID=417948 RepID=UPI00040C0473|nr:ATP-binding protein [Brevibacterium album]
MDLLIVAVLTGSVGLAVGVAGIMAFRLSAASRSAADLHSDNELPHGIAEVLAVLPSAAIVLDAGDDVVKASPTAYTFGLVRGHRLIARTLEKVVERVRTRGLIEEIDFEHAASEAATPRFLHARVAALGPAFVLVLCDDQTESRRVDAIRRDFVANVSHELKTPIGAVALLAEAVTDFADDPEAVARFGTRMQKESARLTQLVQEIIDLSRVQDHEAPHSTARVSVREIVADAVDRAGTGAGAKDIELSVVHGGDWYVDGSYELLVNAVRNLLDNAVGYSNEGTRVGIGTRLEDERVVISVTDQGIGMTTEETERVFERFYRVDPARSRMTGGTGLGLSIVKHIVATHGGEVRVWSRPGHGSTFTIVLPQAVHGGGVRPAADPSGGDAAPAAPIDSHTQLAQRPEPLPRAGRPPADEPSADEAPADHAPLGEPRERRKTT